MSYCSYCRNQPKDSIHHWYHDEVYGKMSEDDNELFGRLVMEINQAGLSWNTVLQKYEGLKLAYSQFNLQKVSMYKEQDISELMGNKNVIRHELKIRSIVYNAQQILEIQKEFGTFKNWIMLQNQISIENWVKLFKKNFKFVGKEIVKEFLSSNGILKGAHDKECPEYLK
ncbi:DNA-3-methyladenine glycosylase I [Crocinitomicaceae bacterium]|nr:DNA-3-methyladenine glycosylase I [Crocinitomicaceae bacterium]